MEQDPKEQTQPQRPIIHTYQDDLARAMDATEASVVTKLMQTAREKESSMKEKERIARDNRWYSTGALILIIIALASGVYGVYHYKSLTVPAETNYAVGIFQSLDPVDTSTTSLASLLDTLRSNDTLLINKPTVVPLVSNMTTLTPSDVPTTLTYLQARTSEPFQSAIDLVRYGVMHTADGNVPFILFSISHTEVATKEFLIAEQTMLDTFGTALGIDTSTYHDTIGRGFATEYRYNLPLRTLSMTDPDTKEKSLVMYYGYATDHAIVMATEPSVLKAIYDTIIAQH